MPTQPTPPPATSSGTTLFPSSESRGDGLIPPLNTVSLLVDISQQKARFRDTCAQDLHAILKSRRLTNYLAAAMLYLKDHPLVVSEASDAVKDWETTTGG